jgi:hypothetical protein
MENEDKWWRQFGLTDEKHRECMEFLRSIPESKKRDRRLAKMENIPFMILPEWKETEE